MRRSGPFYGKYRGVVSRNDDDKKAGRIKAHVVDVYGHDESPWALPAVPYAGRQLGLYLVPPPQALVWIEFEKGDSRQPVWSGGFWPDDDTTGQLGPPLDSSVSNATAPDHKILKTPSGSIEVVDTAGQAAITIKTGGMTIEMSNSGVKINSGGKAIQIDAGAGTVTVKGQTVSVNDGALEVS